MLSGPGAGYRGEVGWNNKQDFQCRHNGDGKGYKMGQITATNGTLTRTFTCEQYALLGEVLPAGFVVVNNTCGVYLSRFRSPFASFGLEIDGTRLPGNWYSYEATINQ